MILDPSILRDVPIPPSRTPAEKLRDIVLSGKVEFRGTSFFDAVGYLRQESVRLDTEEADEELRGVRVWIVDDANAPHCQPALPGSSLRLERLVAVGPCSFTFERISLEVAFCHVARWYGMEVQVTEAGVFLWLPRAMVGGEIGNPSLRALKKKLEAAGELLQRHG